MKDWRTPLTDSKLYLGFMKDMKSQEGMGASADSEPEVPWWGCQLHVGRSDPARAMQWAPAGAASAVEDTA